MISKESILASNFRSKWLRFSIVGIKTKTVVIKVYNKVYGDYLGEIKWYASFRHYSFFPEAIVLAPSCLEDLTSFIFKLEIIRKEKL